MSQNRQLRGAIRQTDLHRAWPRKRLDGAGIFRCGLGYYAREAEITGLPNLTRRGLLAGTAATAVFPAGAELGAAKTPPAGAEVAGVYRYKIGSFELTALYDGIWYRPITDQFIRNAPFSEVEHALERPSCRTTDWRRHSRR